jgi:N-acetylglucosaminyl-diphospho-decaprenol L-rhamnosyltransferase
MKLSVVIICWNDSKYIADCIQSIYDSTRSLEFEIIVTDNASTDGSVELIRKRFPEVRIVQNGTNIGFGSANNNGVQVAQGDYVVILNPDTIVHEQALEKLVRYADAHPEGGAFGCRILNADGSLQGTAQPSPTVFGYFLAALYIRWLGRLSQRFDSDMYMSWHGTSEREIGFHAACALLVRRRLFQTLGGFDRRFFHQFEDADLCQRIRSAGSTVLYYPSAEITHIGGVNRGGYPLPVRLQTERSKCRYFHKHYGIGGLRRIRYVSLIGNLLRLAGYALCSVIRPRKRIVERLGNDWIVFKWYCWMDPVRFIEKGEEPDLGYPDLSPVAQAG